MGGKKIAFFHFSCSSSLLSTVSKRRESERLHPFLRCLALVPVYLWEGYQCSFSLSGHSFCSLRTELKKQQGQNLLSKGTLVVTVIQECSSSPFSPKLECSPGFPSQMSAPSSPLLVHLSCSTSALSYSYLSGTFISSWDSSWMMPLTVSSNSEFLLLDPRTTPTPHSTPRNLSAPFPPSCCPSR